MYFLFKLGIFQPAMLVYQRVVIRHIAVSLQIILGVSNDSKLSDLILSPRSPTVEPLNFYGYVKSRVPKKVA